MSIPRWTAARLAGGNDAQTMRGPIAGPTTHTLPGILDWATTATTAREAVLLVAGDFLQLEGQATPGWGHSTDPTGTWSTYWRPGLGGKVFHLYNTDRDQVRCAIIQDSPFPVAALEEWRELTGAVYHGTPGVAGTAVMRSIDQHNRMTSYRHVPPTLWQLDPTHDVPQGVALPWIERPYGKRWNEDTPAPDQTITLDANVAYLAAAAAVNVARDRLRHHTTPGLARRKGEAGFFLVDLGPWNDPRMPDPAGYGPISGPHRRWVTAPTLDLIDGLAHAGYHAGYSVLESWTAPGTRLLRPWAETIRDALTVAYRNTDAALIASLKAAYRETPSLMTKPGRTIFRPDWNAAVIAQARTTLWRKMYSIGLSEDRWPHSIDVDAVTWPGTQPPAALTIDRTALGAWKVKATTR